MNERLGCSMICSATRSPESMGVLRVRTQNDSLRVTRRNVISVNSSNRRKRPNLGPGPSTSAILIALDAVFGLDLLCHSRSSPVTTLRLQLETGRETSNIDVVSDGYG